MRPQPNIILLTCDQLRAFEVGAYGNGVIRTPNIDRLAREGVRFEHAIANTPLCMPSRSSLISGQFARTCTGNLDNHREKGPDGTFRLPDYPSDQRTQLPAPTLAEQFKKLGYDTALFGKWHIHPAPHLVGFDYCVYNRVRHRHTGQTFIEQRGEGEVVSGWSLDYEASRVRQYLGEDRGGRPFFMFYNISPPHMPLADAPEKYLTMYSPDQVPLRPNVFVSGRPAHDEHWFRIYRWDFLYYEQRLPHTLDLPPGFDLRHLTALYYGMTTWVDDTIGRLLDALRETGRADDTIICFTSDHGDNLGSHHLFNKGSPIEESIRIPLIFHAPGQLQPRLNTGQVAQIVDLMPTLLHLAGDETPPGVQGRDLTRLLSASGDALDQADGFVETASGHIAIRTRTHLYGMRVAADRRTVADDRDCFFDLRADPFEQNNLARTGDQADLAASLRRRLRDWDQSTPWM